MRSFFDPSPPLLTPRDLVLAFTGKKPEDLFLPARAIITFSPGDLRLLVNKAEGKLIDGWSPFRQIHRVPGKDTVIVKSDFGGPNIAALVEELSAFGVRELILWGYCGAIDPGLRFGDIIVSSGALREDGVSSHYTGDDEQVVHSDWFQEWGDRTKNQGFASGVVWSCDAIYRETKAKVAQYREMGVKGVEMEAASFYSVCRFLGVKGIAFLVVSDLFNQETWSGGFRSKAFKEGAKKLSDFILKEGIQ